MYYIRFLDHCRTGYEGNTFNRNIKSGGGGQNSYPDRRQTHHQHGRIGCRERHGGNWVNGDHQNLGIGGDDGQRGGNGGGRGCHGNTLKTDSGKNVYSTPTAEEIGWIEGLLGGGGGVRRLKEHWIWRGERSEKNRRGGHK